MRILTQLIAFCAAAALLAACSGEEDCAVVGDEDGNGLADCDDPGCAG